MAKVRTTADLNKDIKNYKVDSIVASNNFGIFFKNSL